MLNKLSDKFHFRYTSTVVSESSLPAKGELTLSVASHDAVAPCSGDSENAGFCHFVRRGHASGKALRSLVYANFGDNPSMIIRAVRCKALRHQKPSHRPMFRLIEE
jgi:hypothetical protein